MLQTLLGMLGFSINKMLDNARVEELVLTYIEGTIRASGAPVEVVYALTTVESAQIYLKKRGLLDVPDAHVQSILLEYKKRLLSERGLCTKCASRLTELELIAGTGLCIYCSPWEKVVVRKGRRVLT